MYKTKRGFTLIELLVVVLIIGILAAVAVPQYQKAVERAKSAQAVTMLKSVYQAALEYQMANGTWPTNFSDLSVSPNWTGTEKWYDSGNTTNVSSNDTWSLLLITKENSFHGINIGQLSGKYAGGGFVMWNKYTSSTNIPLDSLVCVEVVEKITTPGTYCQKVMQSKNLIFTGDTLRYYEMP